jgi:transcription elongation GreA/GreB family factor
VTVSLRKWTAASRASGSLVKMRPIPRAARSSYVSPLARAVLTHGPGETVEMTGGEAIILDVR